MQHLRRTRYALPALLALAVGLSFSAAPVAITASTSSALIVERSSPQARSQAGLPDSLMGGLAELYAEYQDYLSRPGAQAADFQPSNELARVDSGRVLIDAAGTDGARLRADLEALGLVGGGVFGNSVSGYLPINALDQASALPGLRLARPAYLAPRVGSTTSQGDRAMGTDLARARFGLSGASMTVGVLSDSYDCQDGAATDVAEGDLPAGVQVVAEISSCLNVIDEGRAMLQLVHDVAPGAGLSFHTAAEGIADFAQGIIDLANAGADVIVDDIGYSSDSYFQDGLVAQAVNQVVARGIPYFSAAGNDGRQSYESVFRPGSSQVIGGQSYLGHDFDPGPGVDMLQQITLPPGASFRPVLQWDQPFFSVSGGTGSTNNVDLFLLDSSGTQVIASSTDNNLGRDAIEFLGVRNNGATTATANLFIGRATGPNPGYLKFINAFGSRSISYQFATNSSTLFAHPNAAGAMAVGAAEYRDTPPFGVRPAQLEPFSSAGGTPILFEANGTRKASAEIRQKPEVVGPDGTNTTFFPSKSASNDSDSDGFPNFFGTSAAAPHVAAAAALLRELNPSLPPNQIYTLLKNSAEDMNPATTSFDFDSGAGFVRIDQAIAGDLVELGLNASDPPASVTGGTALRYTLAVSNTGGRSASNTTLVQQFSSDVEVLSATIVGGTACYPYNRTVTCKLGTLQGNSAVTVTVDAVPLVTGTLVADATVSSETTDFDTANNRAVLTSTVTLPAVTADLAITATATTALSAVVGSTLSYAIEVANLGPQAAEAVTATLYLPSITGNISAGGSGWNCQINGGIVNCAQANLATGATTPITLSLAAPATGNLSLTARVRAQTFDPNQANNRSLLSSPIGGLRNLALSIIQK